MIGEDDGDEDGDEDDSSAQRAQSRETDAGQSWHVLNSQGSIVVPVSPRRFWKPRILFFDRPLIDCDCLPFPPRHRNAHTGSERGMRARTESGHQGAGTNRTQKVCLDVGAGRVWVGSVCDVFGSMGAVNEVRGREWVIATALSLLCSLYFAHSVRAGSLPAARPSVFE